MPNNETKQWQVMGNGYAFSTCGPTVPQLAPGYYQGQVLFGSVLFKKKEVKTDSLYALPDPTYQRIMDGITKFWERAHVYTAHGLIHKRGVLLYGPPGSGKTAMLMQVAQQVIDRGGIVLMRSNNMTEMNAVLSNLRGWEPTRPLVILYEDIDQLIAEDGDEALLSLLDGENQIANVIHIATTNYVNTLPARIVNRPSRFDECVEIGMPGEASREYYLTRQGVGADLNGVPLVQVVADTAGFSFAHMKELVVGVKILDRPYEETLTRLRALFGGVVPAVHAPDGHTFTLTNAQMKAMKVNQCERFN